MKRDNDLKFARAISGILVDAQSQSLEQLLERLSVVEMTRLAQDGADAAKAQITRRCVAEARVHVSITRRVPFEVCRQYFDELCDLGFEDPLLKFVFCLIVARYALRCGRPSRGIPLIEPFIIEWETTGQRPGRSSIRFMKEAARLLRELRNT
jgi:ribosomal protein S14